MTSEPDHLTSHPFVDAQNTGDTRFALAGSHASAHGHRLRQRVLRVRITDVVTGQLKVGLTLPAGLVSVAVRMGARLVPAGHSHAELLATLERGELEAPLIVEDVENGELIEISVEG